MVLILLALWSLSGIAAFAFGTPNTFTWLTLLSVVSLIRAIQAHWVRPEVDGLWVLSSLWGIVVYIAFYIFCRQMGQLTAMLTLPTSARSWRTTKILVFGLIVLPGILFNGLALALGLTGNSFTFHGPMAGAIVAFCLAVCFGVVIHFLVSVWRTSSEAFRRW